MTSTLRISATAVEFNETGFTMLIDGTPSPYRKLVDVSTLADVMAAVDRAKADLANVEPNTRDPESNLDHKPNGFKLYVSIVGGRAPNGFRKYFDGRDGRRLLDIRKQAAA